mmetsp:Transcript_491/g.806  ORF Transcript_491/g.806 Transcript_491/m.806 type:complete len:104 (+) Transcript_491:226-537(+)
MVPAEARCFTILTLLLQMPCICVNLGNFTPPLASATSSAPRGRRRLDVDVEEEEYAESISFNARVRESAPGFFDLLQHHQAVLMTFNEHVRERTPGYSDPLQY